MSTYKAIKEIDDILTTGSVVVSDPAALTELQGLQTLNQVGGHENIRLGVAEGVGYNVFQGSFEGTGATTTLCRGLDEGESLTFDRTAKRLWIASTSGNDTDAGSGADRILLTYIDTNGDEQSTLLTPTGQTPLDTEVDGQCVNQLLVLRAGGSLSNEGRVYIGRDPIDVVWTAGKPAEIWHVMEANTSLTSAIWFMVPEGKKMCPIEVVVMSDATAKNDNLVLEWVANGDPTQSGQPVEFRSIKMHVINNTVMQSKGTQCFNSNAVFRMDVSSSVARDITVIMSTQTIDKATYPNA